MKPLPSNEPALRQLREAQRQVHEDGAALDVSQLPTFGFSHRSILWWATVALMAIEGTAFALAIAAYFDLRSQSDVWPPMEQPPAWRWGVVNTAILLVSLVPNAWTQRRAEALDRRGVQGGLVACMAFSLAFLVVRWFEFGTLNCRWDGSAYGSIVWLLMGLHTFHLMTDAWDSGVLTVLSFTGRFEGKRFVDVGENAMYWYFVVWSWLPIAAVVYLGPRAG